MSQDVGYKNGMPVLSRIVLFPPDAKVLDYFASLEAECEWNGRGVAEIMRAFLQ